eukprot:gene15398-3296_t
MIAAVLGMPSYAAPPAPAAVSLRSDSSQIETFGFYWAMQDGSNNVSAPNGRNCSRDAASEGRCSWSHATSAFVQNSWKHPNRWTSNSTAWDVQDVLQLGNVNVTSIVSVSHVFVSFGANGSGYVLLPNYEASWAAYLHEMQASGALQNINAWYPADEPDIKMDAAALNTIVHVLKRDTPHIKVLVTLSSLAVPPFSAGTSQRFNISAVSSEVDVITMDMYCAYSVVHKKQPACQILWPTMLAKLEGLASFAAQNKATQLAVIPDATLATASTIGAAAQRTLNDLFLMWCSNQAACTAEGVASDALNAMGDAARTQDWSATIVGANERLECTRHGGTLTHVACVVGGCNSVLFPLFGKRYLDFCDAADKGTGIVDEQYTCCKLQE